MKNLVFTIVLLLAAGFALGQSLQKGNMISTHILTVELKPGVTLDQVVDYYNTRWIPDAEKYFDWKMFIATGIRSSESIENKLLLIVHFNTEADRDKYFKMAEDGTDLNELGQKAWAQFSPTAQALDALATVKNEWYDWAVK
ncbi:MAG: hypothetical protein SF052_21720 [Bacteroidia bacterium]|nr:hypothetical protein [Bacteroidia bacterium]